MDRRLNILHYLNMSSIPTYALYGETEADARHDWLHWETIQVRSRQHDYRIDPHRHEQFFQLLHLTAGRADMELDGDVFTLRPETIAVVPAGVVHGYAFSADVRGLVVTLMQQDMEGLGLERPQAMVLRDDIAHITTILERLIGEARASDLAARGLDARQSTSRQDGRRRSGTTFGSSVPRLR